MIKKRSRPQTHIRQPSPDEPLDHAEEEDQNLPVADLLELRKLKKSRQGIDIDKLNKGDDKKRKRWLEEEQRIGLQPGYKDNDDDEHLREAKRKVVRSNNFTQQTNALDVDKHMMAYIEQNLTVRGKPQPEAPPVAPSNPYDPMAHIAEKLKQQTQTQASPDAAKKEDGSVTNSITMLTAIPEVDLGISSRIKNIEDTERAKRNVAEDKKKSVTIPSDEAHLVANRFYQPSVKVKSDDEILRDAKLEAIGIPPPQKSGRADERAQMATDDLVMEKFKKRMRR